MSTHLNQTPTRARESSSWQRWSSLPSASGRVHTRCLVWIYIYALSRTADGAVEIVLCYEFRSEITRKWNDRRSAIDIIESRSLTHPICLLDIVGRTHIPRACHLACRAKPTLRSLVIVCSSRYIKLIAYREEEPPSVAVAVIVIIVIAVAATITVAIAVAVILVVAITVTVVVDLVALTVAFSSRCRCYANNRFSVFTFLPILETTTRYFTARLRTRYSRITSKPMIIVTALPWNSLNFLKLGHSIVNLRA